MQHILPHRRLNRYSCRPMIMFTALFNISGSSLMSFPYAYLNLKSQSVHYSRIPILYVFLAAQMEADLESLPSVQGQGRRRLDERLFHNEALSPSSQFRNSQTLPKYNFFNLDSPTTPALSPSFSPGESGPDSPKFVLDSCESIPLHKDCIYRWLVGKQLCNQCRKEVKAGGESGISQLICDYIKNFQEERAVQLAGLKGMAARASSTSYRESLGDRGACALVASLIKSSIGDADIVGAGLEAMANLACDHPKNQDRLATEGIVEILISGLRQYPRDYWVQLQGMRSCSNLAWKHHNNQKALDEAGACDLVCQAMKSLPEDKVFQMEGCGAVADLCWHYVKNQKKLGEAGACKMVATAMSDYFEDRSLQLR